MLYTQQQFSLNWYKIWQGQVWYHTLHLHLRQRSEKWIPPIYGPVSGQVRLQGGTGTESPDRGDGDGEKTEGGGEEEGAEESQTGERQGQNIEWLRN